MSSSEANKSYRCEECGVSFKSQQELQEHNNIEHVGTAWRLYTSNWERDRLTDMSGIHRAIPIPNLGLPVTTTGGSSVVAAFCLKG